MLHRSGRVELCTVFYRGSSTAALHDVLMQSCVLFSTVAHLLGRRSRQDAAVEEENELSTAASRLLRCFQVGANHSSLSPFLRSLVKLG